MRILSAAEVARLADDRALIERLRHAFRAGATVPVRHHHAVPVPGGSTGMLLLMPAWREGGAMGIKIVTVFPDNAARSLPAVIGSYLLLDGTTGAPVAMLDGTELTRRRTAAASALAADYLARRDARRLLMVGTGALAPHLIRAHATVRPIAEVAIWGRDPAKATALAAQLSTAARPVRAAADLEAAVGEADVISCATLAESPLVRGAWLRAGQHLDLVGAFTPAMRESDDDAVRRARLHVDTRAGALAEAGDIVQPIRGGVIAAADIRGDLFDLARGIVPGRESDQEITLFKSVGTAIEDLAAAELIMECGT